MEIAKDFVRSSRGGRNRHSVRKTIGHAQRTHRRYHFVKIRRWNHPRHSLVSGRRWSQIQDSIHCHQRRVHPQVHRYDMSHGNLSHTSGRSRAFPSIVTHHQVSRSLLSNGTVRTMLSIPFSSRFGKGIYSYHPGRVGWNDASYESRRVRGIGKATRRGRMAHGKVLATLTKCREGLENWIDHARSAIEDLYFPTDRLDW
mmetsp:Transcript_10581/g.18949  ORF Transcript_10581/g.18949 Transcript_10581/m.18949 type:complete len:200 (+) Transcript_10581:336-935(+)